jgi:hypothetical protein
LHDAINKCCIDDLRELLQRNANVHIPNKQRLIPLQLARSIIKKTKNNKKKKKTHHHNEIVQVLVHHDQAILYQACCDGNVSVVQMYIDRTEYEYDDDNDITENDTIERIFDLPFGHHQVTPLMMACYYGHESIVSKLLSVVHMVGPQYCTFIVVTSPRTTTTTTSGIH